ncbi:MAG: hypothetical protein Q7R56_02075, partial [Nanoarchaeota archaeon]|nr:hypothetical protein [Nanoarchaeota archaeon]
ENSSLLKVSNDKSIAVSELLILARHQDVSREEIVHELMERAAVITGNARRSRTLHYVNPADNKMFSERLIGSLFAGLSRRFVRRLARGHQPTIDHLLANFSTQSLDPAYPQYWLRVSYGLLPTKDVATALSQERCDPAGYYEHVFDGLKNDLHVWNVHIPLLLDDHMRLRFVPDPRLLESGVAGVRRTLRRLHSLDDKYPGIFARLDDATVMMRRLYVGSVLKRLRDDYDFLRGVD